MIIKMVIKIIIIVIKITVTVIMKIKIVLKQMKIVVQSHIPKAYICPNYDNLKKLLIAQHFRTKCNAARLPKTETFIHFLHY